MWRCYQTIQYPRISLYQEIYLIAKAKKGFKKEIEELILRHVGFIIFRIHKTAFPAYITRFGEGILFTSGSFIDQANFSSKLIQRLIDVSVPYRPGTDPSYFSV